MSATDAVIDGGTISGEEGKPLAVALSIVRHSMDRRVPPVDGVRIRGVNFRHCQTAVSVAGVVKNVRIEGNHFSSSGLAIVVADESKSEVSYARNHGFVTEASGRATISSGATKVTVDHGLHIVPRLDDISVTPTSSLGGVARFWIAAPTATGFDIVIDAPASGSAAQFAWNIGAPVR